MSSSEDMNIEVTEDEQDTEAIVRLVSQMNLGGSAAAAHTPDSEDMETAEEPPAEPQPQQEQPQQLQMAVQNEIDPVQGIARQLYASLGQIINEFPETAPPSTPGPSFYRNSPYHYRAYKRLQKVLDRWRSLTHVAMPKGFDSSDSE